MKVTQPGLGLDRLQMELCGPVNYKAAPMKSALSHNEIEILDRQVATMSYQLSEIAGLLESRLGNNNELATSARHAQQEFAKFAHCMRRRVAIADCIREEPDSRTA